MDRQIDPIATLPQYDLTTRPSMQDDFDDPLDAKVEPRSMTDEEASGRIIKPDEMFRGGKTSASMLEFIPSEETIEYDEGFIEEEKYYETNSSSKMHIPFDTSKENVYTYPDNLNAFVHPYGEFDHFQSPKRPYGKAAILFSKHSPFCIILIFFPL